MDEQNREFNINFSPLGKNFRPFLGFLIIALLLATSAFMIFAAKNEIIKSRYVGQEVEQKNSISISGEGEIYAKPDIGQVDVSVVSEATTVASAQKDNTEKMNKIIAAMKDLGIEEKYLKTTNYSIYPKYQYSYGRSTIIGYTVSQTLEIKIKDLDKVSEILSKATELGANQIGSLNFTFEDPEELKAEARAEAIKNAKEKAETLAKELGVKLVRIISFSESSSEPPVYYAERALGMGGGETEVPQIETGENEITANVTITYEIQ